MVNFYNGATLLNATDINGQPPEIVISDGNRSSGKTTYFNSWLIRRFKKYNEKFMLIYRYKNELTNVDAKFFSDIQGLFFPSDIMTCEIREQGAYVDLYLNDKHCGYAVALNSAYKLKKLSHYFSDTVRMLFDEFQSVDYCPNEIDKFVTLHTSVARGNGQSVRFVPVYMVTNHISSLNPYYKLFNCCIQADRVKNGIIKGDGYVIEKSLNTSVSELQKQSGFNRACSGSLAVEHTINNTSLSENNNFVEKITSNNIKYIANITVDGKTIALKSVFDDKVNARYYFTDKIDSNIKTRFVIDTNDHTDNTLLIGHNFELVKNVRLAFDVGLVRFSDIVVKDCAFAFMAMSLKT